MVSELPPWRMSDRLAAFEGLQNQSASHFYHCGRSALRYTVPPGAMRSLAVSVNGRERRSPPCPHVPLGMNPGTPVSTTALNLTRNLTPSLISCTASSGRAETSKFSLIRLGVFEVVRRAVPRWMAQASKTCAGVLLTRLAIVVMTGSSIKLGSLLCPSAAKACSTMPFFLQYSKRSHWGRYGWDST